MIEFAYTAVRNRNQAYIKSISARFNKKVWSCTGDQKFTAREKDGTGNPGNQGSVGPFGAHHTLKRQLTYPTNYKFCLYHLVNSTLYTFNNNIRVVFAAILIDGTLIIRISSKNIIFLTGFHSVN